MRCLLLLVAFLAPLASAQQPYADVRLPAEGLASRLAAAGVVLDHAEPERTDAGVFLRTVVSADELAALRAAGVAAEVLVPDVTAAYVSEVARSGCPSTPYPITGTHGCYPTYDEVLVILDQMRAQFPDLVSARTSLGTSHEGLGVWMIEIGDNPGVDEGEPEVLLTSLHHAREPQSLASLLHAVWTALHAYGSDPEWTHLLDTRRVFVVPVLNPDGYVYNQFNAPGGGGMWRKNVRDNGDGSFGVDLNRNYGYEWGRDNVGSSNNPFSDTYRGPAPFSEPETSALRQFVDGRAIRIALNTHSYSNVLIHPWGYAPSLYTPDSVAFTRAADTMTRVNGYPYGTADQVLWYYTNGSSDDWMYGVHGILAYTPEIGSASEGFWPPPSRLLPLAEINVDMYRQAIRLAGAAPRAAVAGVVDDGVGANGHPDPGEMAVATVRLANDGRSTAGIALARLVSSTPHLVPVDGPGWTPLSLDPGDEATRAWPLHVAATAPLGDLSGLAVEVTLDDGAVEVLPLGAIRIGTPEIFYETDASSLAGWTSSGGWGVTTSHAVSPPSSFTDSPGGVYPNNANAILRLAQPLDLTGLAGISLEFSARWRIENTWDFAFVEASTNGTTWTPLAGQYTRPASGQGVQTPIGAPGYDGTQLTWVRERISLAAYNGAPALHLRFRLRSDSFQQEDGIYIDDIAVSRLVDGGMISSDAPPSSARTTLDAPSPNPAAGSVRVGFTLGAASVADLAVYDVLGRRVRTLVQAERPAGRDAVVWDTRDEHGAPVAPGVYVLRLVAGEASATRTVLVVR